MTDAIERFADLVVSTRFEDIPASALSVARIFILDSPGDARRPVDLMVAR